MKNPNDLKEWKNLKPFPEPTWELEGVECNGKIYLIGGITNVWAAKTGWSPVADALSCLTSARHSIRGNLEGLRLEPKTMCELPHKGTRHLGGKRREHGFNGHTRWSACSGSSGKRQSPKPMSKPQPRPRLAR